MKDSALKSLSPPPINHLCLHHRSQCFNVVAVPAEWPNDLWAILLSGSNDPTLEYLSLGFPSSPREQYVKGNLLVQRMNMWKIHCCAIMIFRWPIVAENHPTSSRFSYCSNSPPCQSGGLEKAPYFHLHSGEMCYVAHTLRRII